MFIGKDTDDFINKYSVLGFGLEFIQLLHILVPTLMYDVQQEEIEKKGKKRGRKRNVNDGEEGIARGQKCVKVECKVEDMGESKTCMGVVPREQA